MNETKKMNPNPNYRSSVVPVNVCVPAGSGKIAISTVEYWGYVRDTRDLQILRNAYFASSYSISDEVLKAVFGPRPEPEKEPEPAPDPAATLEKVATVVETAARVLENVEAKQQRMNPLAHQTGDSEC